MCAFEFVVVRCYCVFIVKISFLRWYILGGECSILHARFIGSLRASFEVLASCFTLPLTASELIYLGIYLAC